MCDFGINITNISGKQQTILSFKVVVIISLKNIVFTDVFHIFLMILWVSVDGILLSSIKDTKNSRMLFLEMTWLIFIAALKIFNFNIAVILRLFSSALRNEIRNTFIDQDTSITSEKTFIF